jgi:hypothetical protein
MLKAAKYLVLFTILCFAASYAVADVPIVICVEDAVAGCIAPIATSAPPIYVASDGEAPFHPFGIPFDVSDAIQFPYIGWLPDPASPGFAPGFWTQIDPFTWALPAVTPCGAENEPACEPSATWFLPGAFWIPGTPMVQIFKEADGSLSDVFILSNNGPGGSATITFYSDPNLPQIPEPGSMLLFGAGLLALARSLRK